MTIVTSVRTLRHSTNRKETIRTKTLEMISVLRIKSIRNQTRETRRTISGSPKARVHLKMTHGICQQNRTISHNSK